MSDAPWEAIAKPWSTACLAAGRQPPASAQDVNRLPAAARQSLLALRSRAASLAWSAGHTAESRRYSPGVSIRACARARAARETQRAALKSAGLEHVVVDVGDDDAILPLLRFLRRSARRAA